MLRDISNTKETRTAILKPKAAATSSSVVSAPVVKEWSLKDFEIGKKLGKGRYGRVYCVRERSSGFICALKAMDIKELEDTRAELQFQREIEIQSNLLHKNIVRLFNWFYDEKRVYMLIEYGVKGELYKHLRDAGTFSEPRSSKYISQVADALSYLHSKNIIHRDIKPENILLCHDGNIKISDFGWSVHSRSRRQTLCGTLDYLAPELVESKAYDKCIDYWALGVLMYEFLTGNPPFEEHSEKDTRVRISRVKFKMPNVSADAQDLLGRLLTYDPNKRINLKDVQKHSWIVNNQPKWEWV